MRRFRWSRLLLFALAVPAFSGAASEGLPEILFQRINAERASHRRPALRLVPVLSQVAQNRAEEIASGESENTSDKEILERLAKAGYRPRKVSEVVFESDEGGDRSLSSWRGSPTYRELLSEEYRDVGIGFVEEDGILLTVFLFALSARDAFERESAGLRDLGRLRREMLERVNRERRKARVSPVPKSPRLDSAAQGHAEDMARRAYYGHKSPEGSTVMDRVLARGYRALATGENVASGQFSVGEVMDGWMESPPHRENILNRLFTEAGFGVALGTLEETPTVFWVQVFGRPKD